MYKMLFNFTIIIKVPIVVQIKGNIKISNSTLQVKKIKKTKTSFIKVYVFLAPQVRIPFPVVSLMYVRLPSSYPTNIDLVAFVAAKE